MWFTYAVLTNRSSVGRPSTAMSYAKPNSGHRLSVPTPAALKQSGMPPLPPHLSASKSSSYASSNGSETPTHTKSNLPNGYSPSSSSQSAPSSSPVGSFAHHRGKNRHSQSSPRASTGPVQPGNGAASAIIGGIPVNTLIPPPPPPTDEPGPAFAGRFFSNTFYPQT